MPFRSERQRRYLWANKPGVSAEFARDTPRGAELPDRAGARRGVNNAHRKEALRRRLRSRS